MPPVDPVFLMCSERSGSNLLRVMLGAHPEIFAPPPVHLLSLFWRQIWKYGDLTIGHNWEELIDQVVSRYELIEPGYPLAAADLLGSVPSKRFADLYRYVYQKGQRDAGKSQVFIKENHLPRSLGLVLGAFPRAKFVVQVRDPRDFLVSCRRASRLRPMYGTRGNALATWVEDQEGALAAVSSLDRDRFFVQRYEDLICRPVDVLRPLCEFIGVPFSDAMLEFHATDQARAGAERWPLWRNIAHPVMTRNSGHYRRLLGPLARRLVELRCGELMGALGYTCDYPSPSAPIRLAVQSFGGLSGVVDAVVSSAVTLVAGRSSHGRVPRVPIRHRPPSEHQKIVPNYPPEPCA